MGLKRISSIWDPCQDGYRQEFIADTDADLADLDKLPHSPCTGSTAVSLASGKVMVVNTEGKWVAFGEPSGSTGGADDSIVGTWQFNDTLSTPSKSFGVSFKCDSAEYVEIGVSDAIYYSVDYGDDTEFVYRYESDYGNIGWCEETYRTITITEEPTDEAFITWLKENARKIA